MTRLKMHCAKRMVAHGCLAVAISITAGWLIYHRSIVPLQVREREILNHAAEVRARITTGRKFVDEVQTLHRQTASERTEIEKAHGNLDVGSMLVWFPGRVKRHFGRFGITNAITRLNTASDHPELAAYQRTYWAVDLPLRNAPGSLSNTLLAVAELEEAEPTITVIDFAVRHDSEQLHPPTAVINLAATVRN